MAQTTKKAVKKADPHELTRIPEGITPDQLVAQTTMEIPFQFALDLREAFKKAGFVVHEIVVVDLTEMAFFIEYMRYKDGKIVEVSDRIRISSHQMLYHNSSSYYIPMLKGEINIISRNLQDILHTKLSKLEKDLGKVVDYFVGTINDHNRSDLWCTHYEQLKRTGMKQAWRIARACNEWIKDQDYQTIEGSLTYKAFK